MDGHIFNTDYWKEIVESFKHMLQFYTEELPEESLNNYEVSVKTKRLPWGYERKYLILNTVGGNDKPIIRRRIDSKRLFLPFLTDYMGELEEDLIVYFDKKYERVQEVREADIIKWEDYYLKVCSEFLLGYKSYFLEYGLEIAVEKRIEKEPNYICTICLVPKKEGEMVNIAFDGDYEDGMGLMIWETVTLCLNDNAGKTLLRTMNIDLFKTCLKSVLAMWVEDVKVGEIVPIIW